MDKGIPHRLETPRLSASAHSTLSIVLIEDKELAPEKLPDECATPRNNLTSLNNDDLFDLQFSDRLKFSLRKGSCKFDF
jgi:hypothetical protein